MFYTFGHMQVASRLEEQQDKSDEVTVACYKKLSEYLVAKEVLWLTAFALMDAWVAMSSIPLFLLYPWWRKKYLAARSA